MKKKTESTTLSSATKPKKRVNGIKKGKAYEREVANDIGHIFPEAQRNLEYQADEDQGLDIKGTDRIKIQCKFRQNYVPINTIREIQLKNENEIPVLVTKGNHREPMAVLPWKKLVTLLEIAYGLELPFPLPHSKIHNPDHWIGRADQILISPPTRGPKAGRVDYVEVKQITTDDLI